MKAILVAAATAAFVSATALAELDVPSSVFTMEELDEAKAKAAADSEPLIFVYTDPAST